MEARQEPILPPPVPSMQRVVASNIQVLGQDDLLTSMARCCTPVPGDEITGYVTRSRGVTIHRADCPNIVNAGEDERIVPVQWGRSEQKYPVAVQILALDRVGLLRDITTPHQRREREHERRADSVYRQPRNIRLPHQSRRPASSN